MLQEDSLNGTRQQKSFGQKRGNLQACEVGSGIGTFRIKVSKADRVVRRKDSSPRRFSGFVRERSVRKEAFR